MKKLFRLAGVDFVNLVSLLDGCTWCTEVDEETVLDETPLNPLLPSDLTSDQQMAWNGTAAQEEALGHFVCIQSNQDVIKTESK